LRGAAAHTLLVGVDERTCAVARNATIPCFVDGVAPPLSGKQNMFGSQVLLKWWYAKTLLSLGFEIIFSDPDIAWLSDPFARWQHDSWRAFDLQGLSDIRSPNLTVQKHHEITCMRPWMESMYEHGRRSIYPCQSTGLWYMRNRPSSRAMLEGLYGYLRARPNEWEQKAFQLVVMRYLIGLGDDLPPLRYRLLPTNQFINIEYYRERLRLGMSVADMTGVHCGYLKNTADKLEFLEYYGFLHRGLAHHRRVYQDVVALGEVGHGRTFGDSRMYGASDATVRVIGRAVDAEELGNISIREVNNRIVRLRDVARVVEATAEPDGVASFDGEPIQLVVIRKQSGTNTVKIAEKIQEQGALSFIANF
jgi:hypothetical protein